MYTKLLFVVLLYLALVLGLIVLAAPRCASHRSVREGNMLLEGCN